MWRKTIEFLEGNAEYRWSVRLMDSANLQNLSLGYTSVWGGKSLNFQREMKDFGVSGAEGQRQLAESEPSIEFRMGRKIIKFLDGNAGFRGSVRLRDIGNSQNPSLG